MCVRKAYELSEMLFEIKEIDGTKLPYFRELSEVEKALADYWKTISSSKENKEQ